MTANNKWITAKHVHDISSTLCRWLSTSCWTSVPVLSAAAELVQAALCLSDVFKPANPAECLETTRSLCRVRFESTNVQCLESDGSCEESAVLLGKHSSIHFALSFAPPTVSTSLTLSFKTRSSEGQLISLTSRHSRDFVSVHLSSGRPCAALYLHGSGHLQSICMKRALHDARWHHLRLYRQGLLLELSADDTDEGQYVSSRLDDAWSSHRSSELKVHQQEGVILGGRPLFAGLDPTIRPDRNFEGCLRAVTYERRLLPLLNQPSRWAAAIISENVTGGCQLPLSCSDQSNSQQQQPQALLHNRRSSRQMESRGGLVCHDPFVCTTHVNELSGGPSSIYRWPALLGFRRVLLEALLEWRLLFQLLWRYVYDKLGGSCKCPGSSRGRFCEVSHLETDDSILPSSALVLAVVLACSVVVLCVIVFGLCFAYQKRRFKRNGKYLTSTSFADVELKDRQVPEGSSPVADCTLATQTQLHHKHANKRNEASNKICNRSKIKTIASIVRAVGEDSKERDDSFGDDCGAGQGEGKSDYEGGKGAGDKDVGGGGVSGTGTFCVPEGTTAKGSSRAFPGKEIHGTSQKVANVGLPLQTMTLDAGTLPRPPRPKPPNKGTKRVSWVTEAMDENATQASVQSSWPGLDRRKVCSEFLFEGS
ncbi:Laminin G domain [Trinorchestia longiramus]|nr:Laminin G domain [Trinorchestia longiramus]